MANQIRKNYGSMWHNELNGAGPMTLRNANTFSKRLCRLLDFRDACLPYEDSQKLLFSYTVKLVEKHARFYKCYKSDVTREMLDNVARSLMSELELAWRKEEQNPIYTLSYTLDEVRSSYKLFKKGWTFSSIIFDLFEKAKAVSHLQWDLAVHLNSRIGELLKKEIKSKEEINKKASSG